MTPAPISLRDKLSYLEECLKKKAYEDSASHLCDLLEYCHLNIITHEGMMFSDLQYMTKHYGKNPQSIVRDE